MHIENADQFVIGIWRDEFYKKDENGRDYLFDKSVPRKNIITLPFATVMASLISGMSGVLYHAIGDGDDDWDSTGGTPEPTKYDTKLYHEISRLVPDDVYPIKWGYGQALSGTTTTIVDPDRLDGCVPVGRFEDDGWFNGMTVNIVGGTNEGEFSTVVDYVRNTGTLTVSPAFSSPIDSTSQYEFTSQLSASPTNVVEVRTTWDYGSPSDPFNFKYIREQGLFGGNATGIADSGYMLDRITHTKIPKDPTIRLVRLIDLVFRI